MERGSKEGGKGWKKKEEIKEERIVREESKEKGRRCKKEIRTKIQEGRKDGRNKTIRKNVAKKETGGQGRKRNGWKGRTRESLFPLPPPPPSRPSVASFVFWLLVTPFNMGQIASAWQILGSLAAPLLGGEEGWGRDGLVLALQWDSFNSQPSFRKRTNCHWKSAFVVAVGWSESSRDSRSKQPEEQQRLDQPATHRDTKRLLLPPHKLSLFTASEARGSQHSDVFEMFLFDSKKGMIWRPIFTNNLLLFWILGAKFIGYSKGG